MGVSISKPLFAIIYYLNSQFHYSFDFKVDFQVTKELLEYLERMILISMKGLRFMCKDQEWIVWF